MRTANRSLALVLAFMVSVIAAPAYAVDDSPGLLGSVEKTVDSLTAPAPSPTPAVAPKPAGPVKQLTSTADSALGGQTSLSDLALVSTVDEVLVGSAVLPTTDGPEPERVADGDDSSLLESAPSAAGGEQVLATGALTTVLQLNSFSASKPAAGAHAAEGAHISGTSTLPDGGSPLTLAWLVLWFGVVGVGAMVLRHSRA